MRGDTASSSKGRADGGAPEPPLIYATLPSPLEILPFNVDSWSSYSPGYHPRNILVDRPFDQLSRWSSATNNQLQYLVVRLERPAVLGTITFGKHQKGHVCNLREFKVYGGLTTDSMTELLHSGLRDDSEPETLPLRRVVGGVFFPSLYVKVVPILAGGASFNFSIWFLQLRGIDDPAFVNQSLSAFDAYRENEAMRLCLKYFRQRNYTDVFEALQKRCKLDLEHPALTDLHRAIVIDCDFAAAERIVESACDRGLFDSYVQKCTYKPVWRRLRPDGPTPSMRGGHQMCFDSERSHIYLLGGWNGTHDLGDFWRYDIHENRWTLLSDNAALNGGPSARSCHKICFDPKLRRIYSIGGFIEPTKESEGSADGLNNATQPCGLYVYDIEADTWTMLSKPNHEEGTPELLFDHQMCIDVDEQMLYLFGGKTKPLDSGPDFHFSGLYTYDITRDKWTLVRNDTQQPEGVVRFRSRIGHCMLYNPSEKFLYIFGGQRAKEHMNDYYVYHVPTDTVVAQQRDLTKVGGPDAGFTQRGTIDTELREIYVLSGLVKDSAGQEVNRNCFWVLSLNDGTWSRVYQNDSSDTAYWARMEDVEPCPRFAHQLVYDNVSRAHYLFGGTPANANGRRLDDFWQLKLTRPSRADVLRLARVLLRRQQFIELCRSGPPLAALQFLQGSLSEVVDHANEEEGAKFRALSASLFSHQVPTAAESFQERTAVYEELLVFFADSVKQPRENLVSLVKLT